MQFGWSADEATSHSILSAYVDAGGNLIDTADGKVICDDGVTLLDTWRALESLVDEGRCKAFGLSDVNLEKAKEIFESARIKPAVVHVESHPYLPEWELLEFCNKNGIVLQAFAALGHSTEPKLTDDPVITSIAKRVNKTPAQVLLAWAVQRGTALLTTSKTPSRIKENFNISTIPEDAMKEISPGVIHGQAKRPRTARRSEVVNSSAVC